MTQKVEGIFPKLERHSWMWFPRVLHALSSVCPSLMDPFKGHWGNPFLSLSRFIWHLYMCLGILCIEICNAHPHWHREKHTHGRRGARGVTHMHIHKHTPSMQCSKYSDCILAPFSPGWWQVFFPLTWLKWNPIISVMVLQLFLCFEGVC